MSFTIKSILHASVIVDNTEYALEFYHGLLGFEIRTDRPELGYPGAWLQVGEQQIHLLELPNPDPVTGRPAHGGRDRHIALSIDTIDELQLALDRAGVSYTRSKSGRKALFCRDPDGNALEFIESV